MSKKNWVFIFLPILVLTAIASVVSLLTSDFYSRDSATIAVKSHYLDLVNISIVVPIGVFMFVLAMKMSGLIISSIAVAFVFLVCTSMLAMELGLQYQKMHFDDMQLYSMYLLVPLGIFPLITLFRAVSKISSHNKTGDVYASSAANI